KWREEGEDEGSRIRSPDAEKPAKVPWLIGRVRQELVSGHERGAKAMYVIQAKQDQRTESSDRQERDCLDPLSGLACTREGDPERKQTHRHRARVLGRNGCAGQQP